MTNKSKQTDCIETLAGATIQHGPLNNRIYVMKMGTAGSEILCEKLEWLAQERQYTKIFAKVPEPAVGAFLNAGYRCEALIPHFYSGRIAAWFMGKFLSPERQYDAHSVENDAVFLHAMQGGLAKGEPKTGAGFALRPCTAEDASAMSAIYRAVFPAYPFPVDDPDYLVHAMSMDVAFFGVEHGGELVALSSAEMDVEHGNAEMTDFATLPEWRGHGLAHALLDHMEKAMCVRNIQTAYTIARALSPGMNITFARQGYSYAGCLVNNTHIGDGIESMNVWHKSL